MGIYGFRSRTPWKMILAGFVYFGIVIGAMTGGLLFYLSDKTNVAPDKSKPVIKNERLAEVSANPDQFTGYPVSVTGKVFGQVNGSGDRVLFQMWGDPKKAAYNIAVEGIANVKAGDYVRVTGFIKGKMTGTNAFNAQITAIAIKADKVEKISAIEAMAPAKIKKDFGKASNQSGFVITLTSIEYADTETRVYVAVKNETGQKIRFYQYNAKATQGGTQFELQDAGSDYPKIQSDIMPNALSEGVLVFPPLDPNKPAQFFFDGAFGSFQPRFQQVIFSVNGDQISVSPDGTADKAGLVGKWVDPKATGLMFAIKSYEGGNLQGTVTSRTGSGRAAAAEVNCSLVNNKAAVRYADDGFGSSGTIQITLDNNKIFLTITEEKKGSGSWHLPPGSYTLLQADI